MDQVYVSSNRIDALRFKNFLKSREIAAEMREAVVPEADMGGELPLRQFAVDVAQ